MDGTLTFAIDLSTVDVSVGGVRQTGMATMTMPVSPAMAIALLGGVALQPEPVVVPAVEVIAPKAADPLPEEILLPEPFPVPKIGTPAQAFFESVMGKPQPPIDPVPVVLPEPVEEPVAVAPAPSVAKSIRADMSDEDLKAKLRKPVPVAALAADLGVSIQTIYTYCRKFQIEVDRPRAGGPSAGVGKLDRFEDDFLREAFAKAGTQEAAGIQFGCHASTINKKLVQLGMKLPLRAPVERKSRSPLAHMTDDEIREKILAAGTIRDAFKELKTSRDAVVAAMARLNIRFPGKEVELDRSKTFRHRTEGPVLCYGPDPDYSDDEIIEAFGECHEDGEMASGMGRPLHWAQCQRDRLRIHSVTGKVRKDDPAEAAKDMEEYLTRWALSSGTWHLDADGNVLRYPDPSIPLPVFVPRPIPVIPETAPTAGEIVEGSKLKPTPRERLRLPTKLASRFGYAPTRRMQPPISQSETDRLVAEAMAAGRFQKIEPGAAIGAKLSSERY